MSKHKTSKQYGTRRFACFFIAALSFITALSILQGGQQHTDHNQPPAINKPPDLTSRYFQRPLRFEENQGQAEQAVDYIARGPGYTLLLSGTQTRLSLHDAHSGTINHIDTTLLNANTPLVFQGDTVLPGKINYLSGRDHHQWRTGIPTYRAVIAKAVYPGIDLRYHGSQQKLEYDFIVSPGTATDIIRLQITGAKPLAIDPAGDLILSLPQGTLRHHKPVAYQEIDTQRIYIDAQYLLADNNTVGFQIGAYDASYPLIIDPVIDYSAYISMAAYQQEVGTAIAVSDNGDTYLLGTATNMAFLDGRFTPETDASTAVFIVKFSADGQWQYETLLTGEDQDWAKAIAIDEDYIYITGHTRSKDFPLVHAYQDQQRGKTDAFVAKLKAKDGEELVFSSYFGGDAIERGADIAVDNSGHIYVTGVTHSDAHSFPLLKAWQPMIGGLQDAYIAKFAPTGTLLFSTYLGGKKEDAGVAIAVDAAITVAGVTASDDFPTVGAIQPMHAGKEDGFIAQLTQDGSRLHYASYLGGTKTDKINAIAVAKNGEVVVVGHTQSTEQDGFPIEYALQPELNSEQDAFLTKIAAKGDALIFSTYLGGNDDDTAEAIAIDPAGNLYITGYTAATDFPTANLPDNAAAGGDDAFFAKLAATGDVLIYADYFGGRLDDHGLGIAVDGYNNAYIVGTTQSADLPIKNGNPFFDDGIDAFILKISDNHRPEITSSPPLVASVGIPYHYAIAATDKDNDPLHYQLDSAPAGMDIDKNGVIHWIPAHTGRAQVDLFVADNNGGIARQHFTLTIHDSRSYRTTTLPTNAPFTLEEGLIVMEAEAFHAQQAVPPLQWQEYTETDNTTAMVVPNDGNNHNINTDYSTKSPRLDYTIDFTETGTYFVWLRMQGDNAHDDSAHIGLNGEALPSGYRIRANRHQSYHWTRSLMDGGSAHLTIDTPGLYTFNLWMREDGTKIDKLLLTKDIDYQPTGIGPGSTRGTPSNQAPVITSTAITTYIPGEAYSYQVIATDPDDDTLSYQLESAPTGMTIDTTGLIHWTDTTAGGDHAITITVTDSKDAKVSQSFHLAATDLPAEAAKIITIAGTGTPGFSGDDALATAAQLFYPYGIALDINGNVYIADTGNHRIRKILIVEGVTPPSVDR